MFVDISVKKKKKFNLQVYAKKEKSPLIHLESWLETWLCLQISSPLPHSICYSLYRFISHHLGLVLEHSQSILLSHFQSLVL